MAKVNGMGGDITLGSLVLKAMEWSIDIEGDVLETTNFSSGGWRENQIGILKWSGSATAQWDAAANSGAPPYSAIFPQDGSASLDLGDGGIGGTFDGDAVFGKVSIKSNFGTIIEYSVDFTGNGELTFTPLDSE